jgi:hypothetical protein
MARQEVNIGIEGNDGTGDSIRESFRKVNENFRELYSVFGQGGNASVGTLKSTGVIAYNQEVSEKMLSFEGRNIGPYSLKAIYESAYAETVNESQFLVNKGFSDLTYVRTPYRSFDDLKLASVPSTVDFIQVISSNIVFNLIKSGNGSYTSADGAKWNVLGSSDAGLAESYGAAGNGIVNDTTAFNRVPHGSKINLQGKAYLVSSIPQHFIAYNGSWLVGGVSYYLPDQPYTPFSGDAVSLRSYPYEFLMAGVAFNSELDELHVFEIVGTDTEFSRGSAVLWSISKDFGLTISSRKTIFSDESNPKVLSAAFSQMGNGRLGGVITTGTDDEGGADPRKQWFIYTDNWGTTWSRIRLGAGTSGQPTFNKVHRVHGQIIPGFSGSTSDWMVASYDGDNTAKILRTLDNGLTWNEFTLLESQGLPLNTYPVEQTIVPVPGYGWAMLTRVEGPNGPHPLYFSKSTTGQVGSWSSWQNTKIPLGDNPIHAIHYGGQIHILITDRDRFPGTLPNNHLISISVPSNTLWSSPTSLDRVPRQSVAILPATAMGYCHSVQLRQGGADTSAPFLHFLKAGVGPDNTRGSNSQLICLSQGIKLVKPSPTECVQLLDNPGFINNSRGTSFNTSGNTVINISDRWQLQPSGMTITASIDNIPENKRSIYAQWTKQLELIGSASNNFSGITQTWIGPDARRVASLIDRNTVTFRVYGSGPPPSNGINFAFEANEIPVPFSITARSIPEFSRGNWMIEVSGSLGSLGPSGGEPTAISSINEVKFLMTTGDNQSLWNTKIYGVTAWVGQNPPEDRQIVEFKKEKNYVVRWSGATGTANTRIGTGVVRTNNTFRVALSSDLIVVPGVFPLTLELSDTSDFFIEINSDGASIPNRIPITNIQLLGGNSEDGSFVLDVTTTAGALTGYSCGHLEINNQYGWLIVGNGY